MNSSCALEPVPTRDLLAHILPAGAVGAWSEGDVSAGELWPQEARAIANARPARVKEFTTVRTHARTALLALGVRPCALVPGGGGAPRWPVNVVGSMTHCYGFRAAAVAPSWRVETLGIDAEPNDALPVGVLPLVSTPTEEAGLRQLPTDTYVHWDRLLFTAKEATYKAWYPTGRRWLDFADVIVTLATNGTFRADVRQPDGGDAHRLYGRWAASTATVASAVASLETIAGDRRE